MKKYIAHVMLLDKICAGVPMNRLGHEQVSNAVRELLKVDSVMEAGAKEIDQLRIELNHYKKKESVTLIVKSKPENDSH